MDRGPGKDITSLFGTKRHELKLGKSFSKNKDKRTAFHSIRYDFKPASIDHTKEAELIVGEKGDVNITIPNDQTKGVSWTKFKGSKNPYKKDCVLIFDHTTGEFTLEKLSCNIQVKKQRQEARVTPQLPSRPRPAAATLETNSAISSKTSPNRRKEGLHPGLPDLEQSREDDVSPLQPSRDPTPSPVDKADDDDSSSSSSYITDSSDDDNNSSSSDEEEEETKPKMSAKSTESTTQAIHSSPKKRPHLEKLKTQQMAPSSAVMSQLSADLELSESSDDDSD